MRTLIGFIFIMFLSLPLSAEMIKAPECPAFPNKATCLAYVKQNSQNLEDFLMNDTDGFLLDYTEGDIPLILASREAEACETTCLF